jgi:hypothetical protein
VSLLAWKRRIEQILFFSSKLLFFRPPEKIIDHKNNVGEMHMILIFDQINVDEQPYLNWVAANPDGFVANVGRNREDVFLHEAHCRFMTSPNVAKNGFIGPQYYKVCATHADGHALVRWLERQQIAGLCGEIYDETKGCHPHLVGRVKNRP